MFQLMIARADGIASGNEHNPKAVSEIMLVTAHNFSQTVLERGGAAAGVAEPGGGVPVGDSVAAAGDSLPVAGLVFAAAAAVGAGVVAGCSGNGQARSPGSPGADRQSRTGVPGRDHHGSGVRGTGIHGTRRGTSQALTCN